MDIQNKHPLDTTKLKAFFHLAVQKWWIIYAISLAMFFLWLALDIFGPLIPKPADEVVFYPWIALRDTSSVLASILLAALILGCVFYALKKKSFMPALLLAVATLFGCIAIVWIVPSRGTLMTGLEPDPTLTHVDSMRANGHVYNLARHNAFYEVIGQAYVFYECDSLDISCRSLYRYKPKSLDDAYADMDYPPFISSDNTNIALHIAGKVVYTFPISTDN